MDKLVTLFKNNQKYIYIAIAVIVFAIVLYVLIGRRRHTDVYGLQSVQGQQGPQGPQGQQNYPVPSQHPVPAQEGQIEGFGHKKEPIKIVVFYAPWCPHCHQLLDGDNSVWSKLKQKLSGRDDVVFDQIDCDKHPEMATQFKIKGFPTIMRIGNGKVKEYNAEGERTVEALEGFIDSE